MGVKEHNKFCDGIKFQVKIKPSKIYFGWRFKEHSVIKKYDCIDYIWLNGHLDYRNRAFKTE